jgi:TolB-like protein/DNA-binding winged helix-turn-helix (wHTH) protein/Tfp pilus assembly protein PilF
MSRNQENLRFGLYTADLRTAELKKGQDRIPLQNLPFRVLAILVREPGRVVTREELRHQLWSADTFVDFERGISTAVSKLREALGDSAANPRFIETVGRRGYRFIAPVSPLAPAPGGQREHCLTGTGQTGGGAQAAAGQQGSNAPPGTALPADPPIRVDYRRRRQIVYPLSALLFVGAAVLISQIWPGKNQRPAGQREIMSIAVLPLENLSGDPQQEYLSDGLTDAVTTGLAQIADLRVISRTTAMHYKHTQKTTPEIGRELGVDALVEGSVIRSENQLRLNVQLIQTKNERHLWANTYDRELANVLTLQGDLAREIAGQIRLRLTPEQEERLAQKQRVDPETYILYLQGRFYWHQRNEESLTKAIGYFEQAIARDPNFAPAYAGLADANLVLPFFAPVAVEPLYAKAHDAAGKALVLDPGLAEAHNSEAYVRIYRDWNFKGAEEEFGKALAINPNYATAHQWYAELLSLEGRHDEAIAQVTRAVELDAQSAVVHHQAGQILRTARQYSRAMAEYEKSLQLDPQFFQNYFSMYRLYRETGDYEKALDAGQRHAHNVNKAYEKTFIQAVRAYHTHGREAFLRRSLLTWAATGWPVTRYYEVWDYVALSDSDTSLRILEEEYARHNPMVLNARSDPELDGLRANPRFQAFLRKIGLP